MADQSILSSRAIIGMYYAQLETATGAAWINLVSNLFNSDQASETYPFLGQSPSMREWLGGRNPKALAGNSLTIVNKHYEATLAIAIKDMRRDKTAQIQARIQEFVDQDTRHWGSLLTDFILAAPSTPCYDGQYFFDTDHSEGDSGSQSNDITCDISTYPAAQHGTITAPSVEEMQQSIMKGIEAILSFKDNQGQPMNDNAREFLVMVPVTLWAVATAATSSILTSSLAQNLNPNGMNGMTVRVEMNPRLTWTDSFAVFRTDSPIKPLIRQSETAPALQIIDENSEHAFKHQEILVGIDTWRNAGYGYWQRACYVTMV